MVEACPEMASGRRREIRRGCQCPLVVAVGRPPCLPISRSKMDRHIMEQACHGCLERETWLHCSTFEAVPSRSWQTPRYDDVRRSGDGHFCHKLIKYYATGYKLSTIRRAMFPLFCLMPIQDHQNTDICSHYMYYYYNASYTYASLPI